MITDVLGIVMLIALVLYQKKTAKAVTMQECVKY